jgi:Peptidase family M49
MRYRLLLASILGVLVLSGCRNSVDNTSFDCRSYLADFSKSSDARINLDGESELSMALLSKYTSFKLTTDLDVLSDGECRMIPHLIEAAKAMDDIFWLQAYGDRKELLSGIEDPDLQTFARINYGPWDRLANNAPFLDGVGYKPAGANLYPKDMTKAEFEAAVKKDPSLSSLYTIVVRDASENLKSVPYSDAFQEQMERASNELIAAAELAEDPGLKKYLNLRAGALLSNEYQESDLAWMDMKDNRIDVVIGPIETYEDQLFGYKAIAETYILVKDTEWSERLSRYASLLPMLQRGLPVPEKYKQEVPGTDSDLNAYDVIYYAGDSNAGSKTIAINLPNDEEVQLTRGTRRLQLKNSMRAKFDRILIPITGILVDEQQRERVTFDAFFANTMFHEVAHGLGIKNTLDGSSTVRTALKEHASALEEGKADVLGLYMVTKLQEEGELDVDVRDNFVTFMASIFRSVRFGASSAHGRANMIRFNFFRDMGAIVRNDDTGTYGADFEKMKVAMEALSDKIIQFQGDGDYSGVSRFVEQYSRIGGQLQSDLDRLSEAGIPVDIVFEQGINALQ